MDIAPYNPGDAAEISQLFRTTFSHSESQAEGEMVGRLAADLMRDTDPADLYGFVAREGSQIVGSIFFSRITFDSGIDAFILAPVGVLTGFQRKGIGQNLITFGLAALATDGIDLVITYGDPAYYPKVGFQPVTEALIPAPLPLRYPHGWMAQRLTGNEIEPIAGRSHCVEALSGPDYW